MKERRRWWGRWLGREAHPIELDLKHGCQWGLFTVCTDLNTCVPINHSMCVTELRYGGQRWNSSSTQIPLEELKNLNQRVAKQNPTWLRAEKLTCSIMFLYLVPWDYSTVHILENCEIDHCFLLALSFLSVRMSLLPLKWKHLAQSSIHPSTA